MKRKGNAMAAAWIVGVGWAALLFCWPHMLSVVNAKYSASAVCGRVGQMIAAATGFPLYLSHLTSVTPALFYAIAVISAAMLALTVYALLIATRRWRLAAAGWLVVCVVVTVLLSICCPRNCPTFGCTLASLAPLFYYPVAFCFISMFITGKLGLAAGFSWWMFVLWCGINVSMFPMQDALKWEMINTPGQVVSGVFTLFPAMPASLDRIIVIALNGVLYATGIYVLLHLSLSRKLIAIGLTVAVICLAGLFGNNLSFCVVTACWLLTAASLFGWFFIVRGDAIDEEPEAPPSPNDVTFVNRVLEQENFAMNPDKTTFFHLEECEAWDATAAAADKIAAAKRVAAESKSEPAAKPEAVAVEPVAAPSPVPASAEAEPAATDISGSAAAPEAPTEDNAEKAAPKRRERTKKASGKPDADK